MGRPLRIEYPGAFYHITSRGNERRPIFRTEKDYERFLTYLKSASERYGAQIHCFCLMPNHYHLLLETPRGNLTAILHHVNTGYTNFFNTKWKRIGHLFQGRYRALLVEKDSYGVELSRYIHLNPVRAELVKEPSDYLWSSYQAYVGMKNSWTWLQRNYLLGQMGKGEKAAQKEYQRFVEEGMGGPISDPLQKTVAATLLGSEKFIEWVKERWVNNRGLHRDIPALKRMATAPELHSVRERCDAVFGTGSILSRRMALYLSHRFSGLPLEEIGKFFGGISSSAVSQNSRRVRVRLEEDPELSKEIEPLIESLSQ